MDSLTPVQVADAANDSTRRWNPKPLPRHHARAARRRFHWTRKKKSGAEQKGPSVSCPSQRKCVYKVKAIWPAAHAERERQ
jgi:hypothetical protein